MECFGGDMAPVGWRDALRLLARDALRVVVAYALVLQMLAPIAVARAAADGSLALGQPICSTVLPIDAEKPGKAPDQISHNCMLCCLSQSVGILPAVATMAEPLSLAVVLKLVTISVGVTQTPDPGTPPQRAPPTHGLTVGLSAADALLTHFKTRPNRDPLAHSRARSLIFEAIHAFQRKTLVRSAIVAGCPRDGAGAADLTAMPAAAHQFKAGDLTLKHPWTRATPKGAKMGGGFVVIVNAGQGADRLVGGSLELAGRTEVHEMKRTATS